MAFSASPAFANAFAASWNRPWYASASARNAPAGLPAPRARSDAAQQL